ncbi:MAG: 5,6-dimethylbenzimidazole synthase [Proteobacteria bacterium]|nr:5,6-dimethylbenzimidazole synthase [Pseudomonadota bacterium]
MSADASAVGDAFSPAERRGVYRAIYERRDVRERFLPEPLAPALRRRLLGAVHAAPSVGFMQPWRVIRVADPELRSQLHRLVERERRKTARALRSRQQEFLRLKVEGVRECAELWVVSLMPGRRAHVFGRRTLPEMDAASIGCALENLWLAARAEGVGMGWVSLFSPRALARLLRMPRGSRPLAIVCLGHVDVFDPGPRLEIDGWRARQPLDSVVYENYWGHPARDLCPAPSTERGPCE